MNCDRCSEILVDYMDGSLDAGLKEEVREHIRTCPDCSREYEELTEIRRAVSLEASAPVPSAEVLERLSRAAKDETAADRIPLRKKWGLTRILIPALSATIALSVWFYYGYFDTGNETVDMYSREVMAEKASPPEEDEEFPASGEVAAPQTERRKALMQNPSESSLARNAPGEAREELGASAPAAPPEPETYAVHDSAADSPQAEDVSEMKNPAPQLSGAETGLEGYETVSKYSTQLTLALKQQMEGDCGASVRTNKAILNSTPVPPDYIRAYSYRSLAECYEKTGDAKKAIENYVLLMKVSPGEKDYAESRIAELGKSAGLKTNRAIPTAGPVEAE
jgi:hypothetical protein